MVTRASLGELGGRPSQLQRTASIRLFPVEDGALESGPISRARQITCGP